MRYYSDFDEHEEIMIELDYQREMENRYIDGVLKNLKSKNNEAKIQEGLNELYNSIDNTILKLTFKNIIKKYNNLSEDSKLKLMDEIVTNIITSDILSDIEQQTTEDLTSHVDKMINDHNRKEEIRRYKGRNNEMYSELLKDTFADILIRINNLDNDNKTKIIKSMKKIRK